MIFEARTRELCLSYPTGTESLCSGSADQRVKTWDAQHGACVATAKLDGAVSLMAAVDDAPVPLLCATDAATLYCLDPRAPRFVVHSLKPGALGKRLTYMGSDPCARCSLLAV